MPTLVRINKVFQLKVSPLTEFDFTPNCKIGFTKEQLKVQLHSMGSLRVNGTRPGRGNTFIRFDQTYPVPEDCTTTGLQAKFEDGLLYVTFHKNKKEEDITRPGSEKKQPNPAQPTEEVKDSEQQRDEKPPAAADRKPVEENDRKQTVSASNRTEAKITEASATTGGDRQPVEENDRKRTVSDSKTKDERITEASTTTGADRKHVEENDRKRTVSGSSQTEAKATEAPTKLRLKPREDKDTNLGKASPAIDRDNIRREAERTEVPRSEKALRDKLEAEKVAEGKATSGEEIGKRNQDIIEKPPAAEKPEEDLGESTRGKSNLIDESKAAAATVSKNAVDRKQTEGGEKIEKESKLKAENIEESAYWNYKKIVKDLMKPKDEEERKLLVNIGLAALVIVALGAWITYSHWSSAKSKTE